MDKEVLGKTDNHGQHKGEWGKGCGPEMDKCEQGKSGRHGLDKGENKVASFRLDNNVQANACSHKLDKGDRGKCRH